MESWRQLRHLSLVCLSVHDDHDCVRTSYWVAHSDTLVDIGNGLYRSRASGTSHTNQIGIQSFRAQLTFDSHQIEYLSLYTNFKCDCQNLCGTVDRVRYLPVCKANWYSGVLRTWSDSHQIWYLGLNICFKCVSHKLSFYRWTASGTSNMEQIYWDLRPIEHPIQIFRLVCLLLMSLSKIIMIGEKGLGNMHRL